MSTRHSDTSLDRVASAGTPRLAARCGAAIPPIEWRALFPLIGTVAFWFWDAVYAMFGIFLFVSMMITLHRGGMRGEA